MQGLESALAPRLRSSTPHRGISGHPPANRRSGPTTLGLAAIDRTHTAASHPAHCRRADSRARRRGAPRRPDRHRGTVRDARPGRSRRSHPARRGSTGRRATPPSRTGPRRFGRRPTTHPEELSPLEVAWKEADLVLALVEVDPGFDLDILRTWVAAVVPLVSAGRASGELLSTIAQLVREAGIDMPFALLEGADPQGPVARPPDRVDDAGRAAGGAVAMTTLRPERHLSSGVYARRSSPATPIGTRGSHLSPSARFRAVSATGRQPTVAPIPALSALSWFLWQGVWPARPDVSGALRRVSPSLADSSDDAGYASPQSDSAPSSQPTLIVADSAAAWCSLPRGIWLLPLTERWGLCALAAAGAAPIWQVSSPGCQRRRMASGEAFCFGSADVYVAARSRHRGAIPRCPADRDSFLESVRTVSTLRHAPAIPLGRWDLPIYASPSAATA